LKRMAASAGLSVSETKAEMMVAEAIVMANCR
jgi:hypothetical protein